MRFLRTISTPRLLALLAGVLAVAVGGTAIALAAAGGGPVPPRKRLAVAVHDALAAPQVQGVTARIKFTNHLIDSGSLEGADPILTGASGRLWASADHRLRIELQSEKGDVQAVTDGKRFWVYNASSNTVYRGRLPQDRRRARKERTERAPSVARIQRQIARALEDVTLSGATPGNVAGRPSYRVRIGPRQRGGLLGAAELSWDAARGVPLRAAVYARGSSSPALELKATDISFGSVPASAFAVSPPPGAHRVDLSPQTSVARHGRERARRALPFKLSSPARLAGLPRTEVRPIDWDGGRGALVTYGHGLGGVAVIQRKAGKADPLLQGRSSRRGGHGGLELPGVSIRGAAGRELVTPLGTAIAFRRAGVDYTVLGSAPAAKVEAAARGL